jgi:hypothetical protein
VSNHLYGWFNPVLVDRVHIVLEVDPVQENHKQKKGIFHMDWIKELGIEV